MIPQVIAPKAARDSYLWEAEGKNPRVEFSNAVLSALRSRLLRDGGQEFGGILLGTMEVESDSSYTRVVALELFPVEHRYGPTYALSPRERLHLGKRLTRLERHRLKPVGLFRSHNRRGLYMDKRDFELFQQHSNHPASVFLVLNDSEAGVFIWEEGDVRRHVSYKVFPLGEPGGATVDDRKKLEAVETERHRFPPIIPRANPATPARPAQEKISEAGIRPMILGFLAVALPLAAFYGGRELALRKQQRVVVSADPREVTNEPSGARGSFALSSRPVGKYLEFQWDPQRSAVRQAKIGRLTVKDGGSDVQVWLSQSDLQAGRYLYVAGGRPVTAQLDLYSHLGSQSTSSVPDKP